MIDDVPHIERNHEGCSGKNEKPFRSWLQIILFLQIENAVFLIGKILKNRKKNSINNIFARLRLDIMINHEFKINSARCIKDQYSQSLSTTLNIEGDILVQIALVQKWGITTASLELFESYQPWVAIFAKYKGNKKSYILVAFVKWTKEPHMTILIEAVDFSHGCASSGRQSVVWATQLLLDTFLHAGSWGKKLTLNFASRASAHQRMVQGVCLSWAVFSRR